MIESHVAPNNQSKIEPRFVPYSHFGKQLGIPFHKYVSYLRMNPFTLVLMSGSYHDLHFDCSYFFWTS
jgi:hypothetical protein